MKDVDWKILIPVGIGVLLAGAALGTFLIAPNMAKSKEKKDAKKKVAETGRTAQSKEKRTTKERNQ